MAKSEFKWLLFPVVATLFLGCAGFSPAQIAKMDGNEIKEVSDLDLCCAYDQRNPPSLVTSEVQRRGLNCYDSLTRVKIRVRYLAGNPTDAAPLNTRPQSRLNQNPDFSTPTANQPIDIEEFEIPIGKTIHDFTYTREGILQYQGKNLTPSVNVFPRAFKKFKVSVLRSREVAAAIAVDDEDGMNKLFFLDLNEASTIPILGHTAQKIFWSPSKKYMVAYCAYEGQSFVSINLDTKQVVENGLESKNILSVKTEPKWGQMDQLHFVIEEYCNFYITNNCPSSGGTVPKNLLATYEASLDAATLKLTPTIPR